MSLSEAKGVAQRPATPFASLRDVPPTHFCANFSAKRLGRDVLPLVLVADRLDGRGIVFLLGRDDGHSDLGGSFGLGLSAR